MCSKELGLPTWDKPAAPCLSSRIPYGSEVTREKLRQVEAAEACLRKLGFKIVRVRHHDKVARIEIPLSDIPRFFEEPIRLEVTDRLKELGFLFITLDIQGFRSGGLNEALKVNERFPMGSKFLKE